MLFKLETPEHHRTAIGSVVEVFLYTSFGLPLLLLWSPSGDSEDARYIHGGSLEPSRRCLGADTEVLRNSYGGVRL